MSSRASRSWPSSNARRSDRAARATPCSASGSVIGLAPVDVYASTHWHSASIPDRAVTSVRLAVLAAEHVPHPGAGERRLALGRHGPVGATERGRPQRAGDLPDPPGLTAAEEDAADRVELEQVHAEIAPKRQGGPQC